MDVQTQEQDAQTPEQKAARLFYIREKQEFHIFMQDFTSNDYVFLTNKKNHYVYYIERDNLKTREIPFHTVHWNNQKIIELQYDLNEAIYGDSIETDNEEFIEAYNNFYDYILRNLVKYAFHPGADNSEIFKSIDNYVEKSNNFILEYNDAQDKGEYFEETKNYLNSIIKEISEIHNEWIRFLPHTWYQIELAKYQEDESMDTKEDTGIEQGTQTDKGKERDDRPVAPPTNNAGSSSGIPPGPAVAGSVLLSKAQDVHGLMSSQLHDMLHDYAFSSDFSRTSGMDRFVKDVRDKLGKNVWDDYNNFNFNFALTQRGGALVDVLQLHNMASRIGTPYELLDPNAREQEMQRNKVIASVMEIESAHRPFVDRLYRYLYSWFVAHLYNDNTVNFDLEPNRDLFMTMTGSTESTVTSKVHNYFVESCFDAFKTVYEKTNNFITFHNSISNTDSTKITDENTLVEYFVLRKQSGGAGKKRATASSSSTTKKAKNNNALPIDEQKERHKNTRGLILTIAKSFKDRYIPDYPKTYNHFLRAQQDVLNLALRRENKVSFDFDAAILHQAIDIITLNHLNDDIRTDQKVKTPIFRNGPTQDPTPQRYIIDNSLLSKDLFETKIICCQSTIDDGITEFSHYCKSEQAVENNNTMKVKIQRNADLYIEYVRYSKSWQVTWKSNGNEFTYTLAKNNNKLSAEDRFTAAIGNLVSEWSSIRAITTSPQDKQAQRDALSDAMYEHIIFKSMGDILQELNGVLKNGGYTTPGFKNNSEVIDYNNGDALRLVLSNDRPSASRILWYLYNGRNLGSNCNNESSDWRQYVNQQASGGFFNSSGNGSCFIYNPGETNVVPNSKKIYRSDHPEYPLIPAMKNDLFIGKRLTDNDHKYDKNGNLIESERAKKYNPVLYQAYYICYNNNDNTNTKIYLNSLKFTRKNTYSPIMINIINERLLHDSMPVTSFKTRIQKEEQDYDTNHGFMSIDNISQYNYFYYTTADNFYIRHPDDGDNNTFKIHKSLNRGNGFVYEKFVAPPVPPVPLPEGRKIIQLLYRNNSVKVLNSEAYYISYIRQNDPYSLVVYLHDDGNVINDDIIPDDDSDVNTTTSEDIVDDDDSDINTTTSEDTVDDDNNDINTTTNQNSESPPPPGNHNQIPGSSNFTNTTDTDMETDDVVALNDNDTITLGELLEYIQNEYYYNEPETFIREKEALKNQLSLKNQLRLKKDSKITAKYFHDNLLQLFTSALTKIPKNLSNEQINELFITIKSNQQQTVGNDSRRPKRRTEQDRLRTQAGGATEENMNPVIYAGVSILVLLGALTGLKM